MQQLAVGFAREDISPLVPVHMGGYGYRSAKSVGVHDDLTLNAVALSDGAQRVVILVYDLVSFDLEGDAEIKGAVAAATDLPIDAIITNTSHTHAGPMTVHDAYQPYEPAYMGMVIQRSCLAAQVALADQQPASLSVGEAPLDIGHNRRLKAEHGVSLSSNPAGQTWHAVDVWRLQRAHGAPCRARPALSLLLGRR